MSSTNPKKKEEIQKKFREIMQTVSKIKKGDPNQNPVFKRKKNNSQRLLKSSSEKSIEMTNFKGKKNNSERLSESSSLGSSEKSIEMTNFKRKKNNSERLSESSSLGSPLEFKGTQILESSNKNKILNQDNTNNSKKLLNTDFGFLLNLLKEKRKNNGKGLFKKMGNRFDGLKTSMDKGIKDTASSIGTGVKSLGSSVATGVKSLGSSMRKGYDITKKFIVDKTNPEKNLFINISKIKEITQLVKNDCIYIDITHLIRDYKVTRNKDGKYFQHDALLNTIIYSIISNNENNKDNKNLIIYFTINQGHAKGMYIYNVNENHEYIHTI